MKRLILGAGLALLFGCGQNPQSGGGGIEIPNGLNLTVSSADNKPVAGAAVRLMARESWTKRTVDGGSVVLDSAVTDSSGRVSFELPAGEGYWVEAAAGGLGVRAQGDGAGSKEIVLAPLSRLDGFLGSGTIAGVKVRLAGSSRTTVTDAQGRFSFDSLPQSEYSMVAQAGSSRKLARLGDVDLGLEPVSAQGLANDTSALLLEDFSDGDNVWVLHGLFGSGYWWLAGNNPILSKVFGIDGAWQGVKTDGLDRWMSISVDATAMTDPWAALGIDLGDKGVVLPEFSGASAFRFHARGSGTWFLKVVEFHGDTTITWSSPIPIKSTWSEIVVPVGSLAAESGAPQAWNGRPRKVRQFMFQTSGAGTFDLTDFSVQGASLGDWAR